MVCRNATEKKRSHQQQSHKCRKRWHRDDINTSEISAGALVTVEVDARDVIHPQGILRVEVKTKKETEGILVVIEVELLCLTTSMKDCWLPMDKYNVKDKSDGLKMSEHRLSSEHLMISNGTKPQFRRLTNLWLALIVHASEGVVNIRVADEDIDVNAANKHA